MSDSQPVKYEEDEIYDSIFMCSEPFFDNIGNIWIGVYSFILFLFSIMIWMCTKRKIKFLLDPN